MMKAHTFRKLAPLRKWPRPERITQQLEQVRASEAQERDRQIRSELREFTEHFGIGLGI